MGKNGFLTPKAVNSLNLCELQACAELSAALQISNRIKAKGLQKLRWYCQMCQKQCRDENGFKCHLNSDSHQRQMMVFGQVWCFLAKLAAGTDCMLGCCRLRHA